eukprot:CAMPEP_0181324876 /NCGR_PEP_ID=MMETSP1101-20121128/20608_1 /TAXON_ID=46948 /ORGANISM="Rhodomonas abbreviata, Strain Caron Lab Isolate" /LENGTH=255 /DNA_ID=CAMNT_0023433111 /DNA_START=116 /DNA_END=879 /DNA_ORIENTATION=-
MDWLKKAAATAQAKMQEAGIADKLATVAAAGSEATSVLSTFGSSVENQFNSRTAAEPKSGAEGDVSFDKIGPPWVTSHLGLKAYEADMKASILKITEGTEDEVTARLKEKVVDEDFDFDFTEPQSTARAMAALEADDNLRAARHRMVPRLMKEEPFWRSYFFKCEVIVTSYLKMCVDTKGARQPPEQTRYPDASDNVDYEAAFEFASDDAVNKSISKATVSKTKESGLSWEEEMAKELEGIESEDTLPGSGAKGG